MELIYSNGRASKLYNDSFFWFLSMASFNSFYSRWSCRQSPIKEARFISIEGILQTIPLTNGLQILALATHTSRIYICSFSRKDYHSNIVMLFPLFKPPNWTREPVIAQLRCVCSWIDLPVTGTFLARALVNHCIYLFIAGFLTLVYFFFEDSPAVHRFKMSSEKRNSPLHGAVSW